MALTGFGQPIFVGLNADRYSNFNDRSGVRRLTAMGPAPTVGLGLQSGHDPKRGLITARMMLWECPVRACLQAIVCPVKTCGVSWKIYTCLFIQRLALQVNRQAGFGTFLQKMYRHGPDVSTVLCGLHYIGRHREALVRCNFRVTRLLNCQGAARWQFGV